MRSYPTLESGVSLSSTVNMSESKTGGVGETKAQPEPEGVTRSVSIGRSNSMAAEAEANKSLCAPLYQCYEAFTKTRAGSALSREYSFFFNFVFAHLLWWAVAFPTLIDEGYENDISNGGAPHGSDGSGIVPVALFLVIVASFLFVLRFVSITLLFLFGVCLPRWVLTGAPLMMRACVAQIAGPQPDRGCASDRCRAHHAADHSPEHRQRSAREGARHRRALDCLCMSCQCPRSVHIRAWACVCNKRDEPCCESLDGFTWEYTSLSSLQTL